MWGRNRTEGWGLGRLLVPSESMRSLSSASPHRFPTVTNSNITPDFLRLNQKFILQIWQRNRILSDFQDLLISIQVPLSPHPPKLIKPLVHMTMRPSTGHVVLATECPLVSPCTSACLPPLLDAKHTGYGLGCSEGL